MKNVFSPHEQIDSPEAKIIAGIERLSTIFKSSLQDAAKRYNLTPLQTQLLIFIAEHPPVLCSVTHLAKEFSVTKATVSDSLKALKSKGYVKQVDSPHDARAFHYEIEKSARHLARELSQFGVSLANVLQSLDQTEINRLSVSILDLLNLLQKGGSVPSRTCYSCRCYSKRKVGFYCNLLKQSMPMTSVRLDCPEHKVDS